jgi:hypothetical protein
VRRRKQEGGLYLLELLPGKEAVPIQVQLPEGGLNLRTRRCTANERLRESNICKCLVQNYVFPEMKLQGLVISQTELYMFCLLISTFMYLVSDLYIPRIDLQPNRQTDPGNI